MLCTCGWTSAPPASWSPRRHRPDHRVGLGGPRSRRTPAGPKTLDGAGVPYKQLSQGEADDRRVEEVLTFDDPAGNTLEVFHGAVLDHSPVVTPFGARFVTGDQGMGHVVLPALDANGLFEFYTDTLGFLSRGSYRVPLPKEFGPIRIRFLGVNERHHSLAIAPAMTLRDPGLIHMMVEVDSLDAVGEALDRVTKEGFQLSSTLGRHTNDKMVSFYVRAPATGTSSSAPAACGSTKVITPQRRSPPTATGVTSGSATCPPPCGHEFRRPPGSGRIDHRLGPRGGRGDRRLRHRRGRRRRRGGSGRRGRPGAGSGPDPGVARRRWRAVRLPRRRHADPEGLAVSTIPSRT